MLILLHLVQVYVIGDVGILEELDLKGYQYIGGPQDNDQKIVLSPGYKLEHDHDVRLPCPAAVADWNRCLIKTAWLLPMFCSNSSTSRCLWPL